MNPTSFYVPGFHSWITCSHASLSNSRLWAFLRLFLFLMTVLSSPDQVTFGEVSLLDLSDVLLMIRPRVCVWGKGPQRLLILITSHCQNNLPLLRLTLASWLRVLLSFCNAKPVSLTGTFSPSFCPPRPLLQVALFF